MLRVRGRERRVERAVFRSTQTADIHGRRHTRIDRLGLLLRLCSLLRLTRRLALLRLAIGVAGWWLFIRWLQRDEARVVGCWALSRGSLRDGEVDASAARSGRWEGWELLVVAWGGEVLEHLSAWGSDVVG
jgi:hypothetical protein